MKREVVGGGRVRLSGSESARSTLTRLVWQYWWLVAISGVCLITVSVSQVAGAWAVKRLIDGIGAHHWRTFEAGAVVLVSTILLEPALNGILWYCNRLFGANATQGLKAIVFRHVLKVPMRFHDEHHSGDFVSRLNDDINVVEGMLSNDIITIVHQPLLAALSLGYLLTLNPVLALCIVLLGPSLYAINRVSSGAIYRRAMEVQTAGNDLTRFSLDALGAVAAIKALRAEAQVGEEFDGMLLRQYRARVGEWRFGQGLSVITGWVTFAPFAVIFAIGGTWAFHGALGVGALIAAVQLMNYIVSPFGNMAGAWSGIQRGRASLARLDDVLREAEEDQGRESQITECEVSGIRCEHVTFGYASDRPVLSNVSLEIPHPGLSAIVGPNGSGKSTLAKLLVGLYTPQGGRILFGRTPIDVLPVELVRSNVVYVPQEPYLMDRSVADNLRLGHPNVGDAEIRAVLTRVGLTDDAFPGSGAGERGKRLSGGQRVRVSLARALLSQAPVWVLDEPSAGIDADGLSDLRALLLDLASERTVIVITHEPQLATMARRTYRVNEGAVLLAPSL